MRLIQIPHYVPDAALLQDDVVLSLGVAGAVGNHKDVRRHQIHVQVCIRDHTARRLHN